MDVDRLFQDKFQHPLRILVEKNGIVLPQKYWQVKSEIDNLEVNKNDIWICSFPKCGTTWTEEMVWMIVNNLDFEKGKQVLDKRCIFIDYCMIYDFRHKPEMEYPAHVKKPIETYMKQSSPRVVKTHLPLEFLPKQVTSGTNKPKLIYVTRDPRDVCVSYYHHAKLFEGFIGSFEEWCQLFLAGKVLYAPFWNHVLPFWKHKNDSRFLFLKYEDMKKDLKGIIRQVAIFLEHPLTEAQVQTLSEHLKFENMKNNPAVNKEKNSEAAKKYKLTEDRDGKFMRSGKVGDHKTTMAAETVREFDSWIQKNIENTDYIV